MNQSVTFRFWNFCQFFEGLGFSFRKFVLRKKVSVSEYLVSEKCLASEYLVLKKNEAEWQERLWGRFQKSSKTIITANMYIKENNLRLLSLWKTPPSRSLLFSPHSFLALMFSDSWWVRGSSFNRQRNNFLKLRISTTSQKVQ